MLVTLKPLPSSVGKDKSVNARPPVFVKVIDCVLACPVSTNPKSTSAVDAERTASCVAGGAAALITRKPETACLNTLA